MNNQLLEVGQALKDSFLPSIVALAPLLTSFGNWIADVTGTKEQQQQRKDSRSELGATNTYSALLHARNEINRARGSSDINDKAVVDPNIEKDTMSAETTLAEIVTRKKQELATLEKNAPAKMRRLDGTEISSDPDYDDKVKNLRQQIGQDEKSLQEIREVGRVVVAALREGIAITKMPDPKVPPKASDRGVSLPEQ